MFSVYKRELRDLFCGYRGYTFIALFSLGYCAVRMIYHYLCMYQLYQGVSNIEDILTFLPAAFALSVPVMTFSLYENERKNNVFSFLRSLPLTAENVVLGKYLALLTAFIAPYAVLIVSDIVLGFYSGVSALTIVSGIVAYIFICNAMLALNVFLSSAIKNKFVALGVSYGVSVALVALVATSHLMPHWLMSLVNHLSVIGTYTSVVFGHMDITAVVLWLTMVAVFGYLSFAVVKSEMKREVGNEK